MKRIWLNRIYVFIVIVAGISAAVYFEINPVMSGFAILFAILLPCLPAFIVSYEDDKKNGKIVHPKQRKLIGFVGGVPVYED